MGLAFRIMIFMLLFNLAVGMLVFVGGSSWTPQGTNNDDWQINDNNLNNQFNRSSVLPAESSQNFWYRFLDIISLGLFNKIQVILDLSVMALPKTLLSMGWISEGMRILLNALLTIIYVIGFIELFSGKDLTMR